MKARSLLLALLIGLAAVFVMAPAAVSAESYDIWVGDTQVTDQMSQENSHFWYDKESNTLTLREATVTGTYVGAIGKCGIYSQIDDLTIELIGTNKVVSDTADTGIQANNLTIKGTGTLTVKGDALQYGIDTSALTINVAGFVSAEAKMIGIRSGSGGITINGGKIIARATTDDPANYYAITSQTGQITMPEHFIETPDTGVLGKAPESGSTTVLQSETDNTVAKEVVINGNFHTVTFEAVGGYGVKNEPAPQRVAHNTKAKLPDPPTKPGSVFDHWCTDSTATVEFDFNTPITEDIILYGTWIGTYSIQVSVENNIGGTVYIDDDPQITRGDYPQGSNHVIHAVPAPGYKFKEWLMDSSHFSSNKDYTYKNLTGNLSLYAVFVEASEFDVTFEDGLGKVLKTETVKKGEAATAPEEPTRDGYIFNGWDTDFSNVMNDLKVIAQWKENVPTFTVTFEDGQGAVLKTETVLRDRPATAPEAPARAGYVFAGWDKTFDKITADTVVKALWVEDQAKDDTSKFTVVFTFGFGLDPVSQVVSSGSSATPPEAPEIDGFTFNGWDKDYTKITANTTLTAQWKKNTAPEEYTVVFVDGYSAVPLEIQRVSEGSAATPPADPTRTGYVFTGWDTDFSYVTSNLTVIAQWKQDGSLADNTLAIKGKTLKVKAAKAGKAKVVKKTQNFKAKKAFKITDPGQGALTYKKANKAGKNKIVVKKNGKIIVKKGLKKGAYKVKVNVTAAGDSSHYDTTVKTTVKVAVK